MSDARPPTKAVPPRRSARDERLARALRDNLRRRKEQARARERTEPGKDESSDETGGAAPA